MLRFSTSMKQGSPTCKRISGEELTEGTYGTAIYFLNENYFSK